jgi:hypothetical protein
VGTGELATSQPGEAIGVARQRVSGGMLGASPRRAGDAAPSSRPRAQALTEGSAPRTVHIGFEELKAVKRFVSPARGERPHSAQVRSSAIVSGSDIDQIVVVARSYFS